MSFADRLFVCSLITNSWDLLSYFMYLAPGVPVALGEQISGLATLIWQQSGRTMFNAHAESIVH